MQSKLRLHWINYMSSIKKKTHQPSVSITTDPTGEEEAWEKYWLLFTIKTSRSLLLNSEAVGPHIAAPGRNVREGKINICPSACPSVQPSHIRHVLAGSHSNLFALPEITTCKCKWHNGGNWLIVEVINGAIVKTILLLRLPKYEYLKLSLSWVSRN